MDIKTWRIEMVSFTRKITVVTVFLLGLIATIVSWFMFHDSLAMFVVAAITCITLLATVLPKKDFDLCLSALFVFFNVGLGTAFIIGEQKAAIGIFGVVYSLVLFGVLMMISGLSLHNQITDFASLWKAVMGNEESEPAIS